MQQRIWASAICVMALLGLGEIALGQQSSHGPSDNRSLLATGNHWRSIRGTDGTGQQNPGGILSQSGKVSLKVRWKKKIGSGYSSVVISDGKAITLFTKADGDYAICLDANDGNTLWETKIDKVFKGENGSFDGPISTPLIYDGRLFALTPYGKLHAIDLSSGKIQWTLDAVKDGHRQPMYGFSTCPIVAADTIVVQLGGSKKATVGIEPATGKVRWKTGTQLINSQIPTVMKFGKQEVVLAFGGKGRGVSELQGIDPKTGQSLFVHKVPCGNGSAVMPSVTKSNLVVLTVDDRYSKAVQIEKKGDKFVVTDAWKNKSIKNTYNVPAICDDYLYAFSTRFLTCVDPEDGEAVWKDRNPGDGFLISVDNHLIVSTKRGEVYIASPSDEEFTPIAQAKVFKDLVWSIPSYSDNAVFQRSLGEIARVDIVSATTVAKNNSANPIKIGKSFQQLLTTVSNENASEKQLAAVNQFVKNQKSLPYIEDSVAHFLLQSKDKSGNSDVALACDAFGARQERKMIRIGKTNWFYYPMLLPNDQRMNYVFLDNYQLTTDPKNPNKTTSTLYAGEMEFAVRLRGEAPLEMSWFGMPKWSQPEFLKKNSDSKAGKVSEFQYKEWDKDAKGPRGRPLPKPVVNVYLPAGYESSEQKYPVIYIVDGDTALKMGALENSCNNLFTQKKAAIVVTLPMGVPGKEVSDVLIPAIDKKFRTVGKKSYRSIVGFGFASDAAMITGLSYPKQFGSIAIQSSLAFDASRKQIEALLKDLNSPVKIQIFWGNYDMNNPVENWDIRKISKTLFDAAKESKNATVVGGQVNDTTDWSSWRNRWDKVFTFVLGS